MLTAAVRDLHRAYPGRFATAVDTTAMELWDHNPLVTKLTSGNRAEKNWRMIHMRYPLVHRSNQSPGHFLHGYVSYLEEELDLRIPVTEFRGDVYLSEEEERKAPRQVEEAFGHKGPYWIMMAGGKFDFTAKWWPPEFYQEVVDHFRGRVTFVQCGEQGHWHPPLSSVLNLVGKTDIRQFIRLMYHAQGVVCPVTFAMHLAAAVPMPTERKTSGARGSGGRLRPCVVIAGGREPPHWEAYPGHQFLHTIGMLPCCATGGCWKSRCQTVGDGDAKDKSNLCERPVQIRSDLRVAQCMAMITPKRVIEAIENYVTFGSGLVAPPKTERKLTTNGSSKRQLIEL